MKVFSIATLMAVSLALSGNAYGDDKSDIEKVRAELAKMMPMASQMDIQKTDAEGVYQGELNGNYIYVHVSGDHVLVGDLLNTKTRENLGEVAAAKRLASEISSASTEDMIIFESQKKDKQEGRYITVFTDIDCGYCRKLHNEVPALNEAGIDVRYLAYPRAGIGSASYKKYVSVWCNADQQDSLTRAKAGQSVAQAECDNPIAKTFNLGRRVGVRGTPTIIFDDGTLLPGYLPAAELIKRL
jgi:thiol:disulfide interchange protein DsbC